MSVDSVVNSMSMAWSGVGGIVHGEVRMHRQLTFNNVYRNGSNWI